MEARDIRREALRKAIPEQGLVQHARPPAYKHPQIEWVVGWFNETLPGFLEKHPQNISFVHIDCDIYSLDEDCTHRAGAGS